MNTGLLIFQQCISSPVIRRFFSLTIFSMFSMTDCWCAWNLGFFSLLASELVLQPSLSVICLPAPFSLFALQFVFIKLSFFDLQSLICFSFMPKYLAVALFPLISACLTAPNLNVMLYDKRHFLFGLVVRLIFIMARSCNCYWLNMKLDL